MLKMIARFLNIILCFIQRWWRPITCVGIAGSMVVNGIVMPLVTKVSPDLMGLAALVTSCAAAFAVREWGKAQGNV